MEETQTDAGESVQSQPKFRVCPECGGSKLMRDYDAAEVVCVTCGCVIDEKITDTRPEWRAFDDEQKSKRARRRGAINLYNPRQRPLYCH